MLFKRKRLPLLQEEIKYIVAEQYVISPPNSQEECFKQIKYCKCL